ncbi:MAG TPA: hypothetical protein VMX94_12830 [Armatimonadota bacterium]|nr:hypothetical protein [Armatimonadota bacterium]
MNARELALVGQVRYITLSEFKPDSGTAAISFYYEGSNGSRSVRMNLLTGEILPSAPQPRGAAPPGFPVPDDPTKVASPSGRLVLYDEISEGRGIVIKTAKGRQVGELSGKQLQSLSDIAPTPDDAHLTYTVADSEESHGKEAGFYLYSIKTGKSKLLVKGPTRGPVRSPDGRFLVLICVQTRASKGLPESIRNRVGTLVVLDGKRGFKRVFSGSKLVEGLQSKSFQFSPAGGRIAFIELARDEYGGYDNTSLQVLDIESERVTTLVTGRRTPDFLWAGESAVAITTYNKFAVPTLSFVDLASLKATPLTTNPELSYMKPLAYIPTGRRVAYAASRHIPEEGPEELWAVEPGRQPVRLFPRIKRSQP